MSDGGSMSDRNRSRSGSGVGVGGGVSGGGRSADRTSRNSSPLFTPSAILADDRVDSRRRPSAVRQGMSGRGSSVGGSSGRRSRPSSPTSPVDAVAGHQRPRRTTASPSSEEERL